MAQARLSVRKIREVLRLRAEGYSEREIARSVGVRALEHADLPVACRASRGWLAAAGRTGRCGAWRRGCIRADQPGVEVHPTPDFEWIERELQAQTRHAPAVVARVPGAAPRRAQVHRLLREVPALAAQAAA